MTIEMLKGKIHRATVRQGGGGGWGGGAEGHDPLGAGGGLG